MKKLIDQRKKAMDDVFIPDMITDFESSNVHSFGYDPTKNILYIRFWKDSTTKKSQVPGPIYKYFKVPERVFRMMYFAKSKGEFVDFQIKKMGGYRYMKIGRAGWRKRPPKRQRSGTAGTSKRPPTSRRKPKTK